MGTKKIENKTTNQLQGRGSQESSILSLFARLAESAGSQLDSGALGDLLADGTGPHPGG